MAKLKLKPLEEMNQQQQLVYEMLNTGDREVYSGYKFTKSNLSRRKLSERLKMDDVNARKVVKSLLPFIPVVASRGYFIADSITDIDKYIDNLTAKIKGLETTIEKSKDFEKD